MMSTLEIKLKNSNCDFWISVLVKEFFINLVFLRLKSVTMWMPFKAIEAQL